MSTCRTWTRVLAATVVALTVASLPAQAVELFGTVKSVNTDEKTFVVTEDGTAKDIDVKVSESTTAERANGKAVKNFDLARLKPGTTVAVTHEDGIASKVVLKKGPGKKKGPDKAKGSDTDGSDRPKDRTSGEKRTEANEPKNDPAKP